MSALTKLYKPTKFKAIRKILGGILLKIFGNKRRIFSFMFPCEHTHTFTQRLEHVPWYYKGESKGLHNELMLVGCYRCGRLVVRDYGA